jgi:hypothetical protein
LGWAPPECKMGSSPSCSFLCQYISWGSIVCNKMQAQDIIPC